MFVNKDRLLQYVHDGMAILNPFYGDVERKLARLMPGICESHSRSFATEKCFIRNFEPFMIRHKKYRQLILIVKELLLNVEMILFQMSLWQERCAIYRTFYFGFGKHESLQFLHEGKMPIISRSLQMTSQRT